MLGKRCSLLAVFHETLLHRFRIVVRANLAASSDGFCYTILDALQKRFFIDLQLDDGIERQALAFEHLGQGDRLGHRARIAVENPTVLRVVLAQAVFHDGIRQGIGNQFALVRVRADLLEMSEESFDYVLGVNTKGNMFLTQAVAKQMIRQEPLDGRKGVIVNVSSCSSVVSSVNRGEYCVSKAGVSMLTTLYADRLAQEGILVHEVRPGVIATDMTSAVQDKYDKMIGDGMFPIARWGTPQDVANAVSALCSDKFLYTTGNYIDVDGGFHIKRL